MAAAATAVAASRTITETIDVEPTMHMKLAQPVKKQEQTLFPPRPRKIRLDPLRALEPARKKITTIEAQRVMAVFDETMKRVEIMTLLPHIISNLDRFKVILGYELAQALEKHGVIIDSYSDIRNELTRRLRLSHRKKKGKLSRQSSRSGRYSASEASVAEDGDADIEDELEDNAVSRSTSASSRRSSVATEPDIQPVSRTLTLVAQQLSHSCKNILRLFSINPAAMNAVLAESKMRTDESKDLAVCLQELKDILMGKLLTTPEEEKERMAYLQEVSEREQQNAVIIEKLEAHLKAAIEDKDEEIRKKNDIIRRLQSDLHQIERFSEEHIRRVKAEAEKQEAADIKNSDGKRQKLQQEMSQLKTQLQNLTMEHRDSEQDLRRKKFKIETEVENWIQKYDQDMGERQDEYEEIDAIYTEEKKQLHELEERFNTLEAEYNQIMEERRIAREKREAAEREMAMMVKCATTIQAFWRSYKVRKALKSKKKKGGKKKR